MVVSKDQFNTAMTEINESYAKLMGRIDDLEEANKALSDRVAELEKQPKSTRAKTAKAA